MRVQTTLLMAHSEQRRDLKLSPAVVPACMMPFAVPATGTVAGHVPNVENCRLAMDQSEELLTAQKLLRKPLSRLLASAVMAAAIWASVPLVQAQPPVEVIKLFDERLFEAAGPILGSPVVRETKSVDIILGAGHIVVLSSSPDGNGIPNMDDFITVNGQRVQSGRWIPLVVFDATGVLIANPKCVIGGSVNNCSFPLPHHHPVDVTSQIPMGFSTVRVDIMDWGGGYGHTELYLVIYPRPLQ